MYDYIVHFKNKSPDNRRQLLCSVYTKSAIIKDEINDITSTGVYIDGLVTNTKERGEPVCQKNLQKKI